MRNPLGIDRKPYFSWKLKSEEKDVFQKTYQILVREKDGTVIMDSGTVKSDENTFIPFLGELRSRTSYEVSIKVEDNKGNGSQVDGLFETAMLEEKDWEAHWAVSSLKYRKRKPGFGLQSGSTLFRKEFMVKKPVKKARLYATCHGAYEVYLNGDRPDERFFAPEHTVYEKYLCYQTYDVTDLIEEGNNVIAMEVADGWYYCPQAKPNMKTDGKHAVLFQLEITSEDGETERVVSGKNVKVSEGAVLSADLYAGEYYNANLEKEGWNKAGYDDTKWLFCEEKSYGYHNLIAQFGEPVKVVKTVEAENVTRSPKGEWIIDFGQNMAGVLRVRTDLPKGSTMSLEHCEVLDKEGNFFNNIMGAGGVGKGCDQKDVYISNGKEGFFEPRFTYHGFRYVRVMGLEEVRKEDFTALVLSSEKENNGSFDTSDELINRLYQNIRWSQTSNMLSIPTDCPQREKAGWTGDMLVYAKTAMLNEDCTAFFSRWLENMSCDQDKYGKIPMVVPNNGNYPLTGIFINLTSGEKGVATSSGWGDAAIAVPYSMYEVTGNKEILKQQYLTMKKWADYIIKTAASKKPKKTQLPAEIENYLWDTGYHYGEWLIPSQNKNGLDLKNLKNIMATSSCYTAPIFGYYSVSTFAKIASLLGKMDDQRKYAQIADRMKNAIQKGIMNEDGSMPSELMGAYVLSIYFDLVPEKYKESFKKHLMKIYEANGRCMDTGFLGTPYLLDAMSLIHEDEAALELLWQKKVPSWLSEVLQGATTIWENCFGYDQDGNPGSLSFNHYAFGCVLDWVYRNLSGIRPMEAGYKQVEIRPLLTDRLSFCHSSYESMQGTIDVKWENKDKHYVLKATIPCNTKACIVLPDGTKHNVGSGSYEYHCSI